MKAATLLSDNPDTSKTSTSDKDSSEMKNTSMDMDVVPGQNKPTTAIESAPAEPTIDNSQNKESPALGVNDLEMDPKNKQTGFDGILEEGASKAPGRLAGDETIMENDGRSGESSPGNKHDFHVTPEEGHSDGMLTKSATEHDGTEELADGHPVEDRSGTGRLGDITTTTTTTTTDVPGDAENVEPCDFMESHDVIEPRNVPENTENVESGNVEDREDSGGDEDQFLSPTARSGYYYN